MDGFASDIVGTGVSSSEALIVALLFLCCGFFVAWRSSRLIDVVFLIQFIGATTMARYMESYVIYHKTLREGFWPIVWSLAAVLGVYLATHRLFHKKLRA